MSDILVKPIPVFLFFGLGVVLKRTRFSDHGNVDFLRMMDRQNKSRFKDSIIIFVSCFSIQAAGIEIYNSYRVFFNPMISESGWSRALISGVSPAAFYISGLFVIFMGRLKYHSIDTQKSSWYELPSEC